MCDLFNNYDLGLDKIKINKEIREDAVKKRRCNIESFSNINRTGLEFEEKERQMLLYETKFGEKIYIQYPGKESKKFNKDKSISPWDFRPKLQLRDNSYMKDLSFADIWDDLYDIKKLDKDVLAILATVFFRMAYMIDTQHIDCNYLYQDIDLSKKCVFNEEVENLKYYAYKPNIKLVEYLNKKIGQIRGASIEAYLYYNDLLVQNEDCKYFYKDVFINKKDWNNKVGKHNTLMTHISVIGFLKGDIKFSQIMDKFSKNRGVAPVLQKDLSKITNGLVNK